MKKRIRRIVTFGLALLLSGVFGLPIFASGVSGGSDPPTPMTGTEDLSIPEYAAPNVPVTAEPVTTVTTSREPAVVEPPVTSPTPNITGDSEEKEYRDGILGWFQKLWDSIKNIPSSIANIPSNIKNSFVTLIKDWAGIGSGRYGLLTLLEDGGSRYAGTVVNNLINALYSVFYVPGIVIMMICFCYSCFRGCYSMELGDRNSVVKPIIGMVITLFAFTMSKDILTAFYQLSMELTAKIVSAAESVGVGTIFNTLAASGVGSLGYMIVNGILELILMLNIAKIALMQCTAPLYIGFASAENSRRIMINFLKEYAKCCLIPPITATYALFTFAICDNTWKLLGSIVLGISIWSFASKHLDKTLN